MSIVFKIARTAEKMNEINSSLVGYWQNDVWDINDSFFDDIRPINWNRTKIIDLSSLPLVLRNEMKYFFVKRLKDKTLQLHTMSNYGTCIRYFAEFLKHYYPKVTSFIDIAPEKVMLKWRSYLVTKGLKVNKDGHIATRYYETMINQLFIFFINNYDTRNEFDKDIWDSRKIPGAKFTKTQAHYTLNFTDIPLVFRALVKKFIKIRIGSISLIQCAADKIGIKLFLIFINKLHPTWDGLQKLSRIDMEEYLVWSKKHNDGREKSQINHLVNLRTFLNYIQRAEYPEAPKRSINLLLWKEDFPRQPQKTENSIKFIPEEVLQQLEDNIEYLESAYIPIVLLLRASGWRISDIFNLRYNTCLERTAQGWWLCGDIPKTQVLNHRVPITEEIAAVVQAVIEEVKEKSTLENNPNKYLFVLLRGKRKGLPPESATIGKALNRLAKYCSIVDDRGEFYHFRNHAFRHTKAIELINNGMNIIHVQKWMAHASPEMTLRYAKILDNTMRKSWEEAMKNGAFRLDADGKPIKVDVSTIENGDVIEWEYIRHNLDAVRMPLGYCLKPKKIDCKHQLNPCLNCRNLCTTSDFIPQYKLEVREVKTLIERGKAQNQNLWVEKNQHLLERYEAILAVLKEGKAHHLAGKKGREYVEEERQNVKP